MRVVCCEERLTDASRQKILDETSGQGGIGIPVHPFKGYAGMLGIEPNSLCHTDCWRVCAKNETIVRMR